MSKSYEISRRRFVTTAVSAAAVSSPAVPEVLCKLAKSRPSTGATNSSDFSLTDAAPRQATEMQVCTPLVNA